MAMVENSFGETLYPFSLFFTASLFLISLNNFPVFALCSVNTFGVSALEKVLM